MDACEYTVPYISPHILAAQTDHLRAVRLRAVCKQRYHRFGGKLHQDHHTGSEADGDTGGVAKRKPRPFRFACPDILRAQSRYRRQHGRGNQKQETDDLFHDPHSRGVVQAPAVGDDGDDDKRDLDQPVLHGNGNADPEQFRHNRTRRTEVGFFYGKSAAVPADDNERNDHADRLGKSGTKGGAGRSQMQGAHKEIIQRDIGGTGNGDKIHGAFAVAQPAENGADDIIRRDKRDADKTDGQILYGSRYRGLRRGHYIVQQAGQK